MPFLLHRLHLISFPISFTYTPFYTKKFKSSDIYSYPRKSSHALSENFCFSGRALQTHPTQRKIYVENSKKTYLQKKRENTWN